MSANGSRRSSKSAAGLAVIAGSAILLIPAGASAETCLPGARLPSVTLPSVTLPPVTLPTTVLPATTIPAGCAGSYCWPARTIPGRTIPGRTIPGRTIPGRTIPGRTISGVCFSEETAGTRVRGAGLDQTLPADFSLTSLRTRVRNYAALDNRYSPSLTTRYWARAGSASSVPDVTAVGFGGYNAAGYPKNEYVRSYVRRDGTAVYSYWRNSSSDSLPTCRVISC